MSLQVFMFTSEKLDLVVSGSVVRTIPYILESIDEVLLVQNHSSFCMVKWYGYPDCTCCNCRIACRLHISSSH